MKVLILAAGYGTRFARDLESHKDEYPNLVGVAKPLLPVSGQPLISHWIDTLRSCDQTRDCQVYVVVIFILIIVTHGINSFFFVTRIYPGECVQSRSVPEMVRGLPSSETSQ